MSWILWEGWISIAYLKTKYQDQCPGNTLQIALDIERRLILHQNIDFLGLKITWVFRPWMIRYFGVKIQKIREDLTGLGKAWIDMNWNLGRGLKETWIVNNSVFGNIFKKIIPYYVHTRHKWHSFEIWSKTEHIESLGFRTRGSWFQLSHQDQELILEKNDHGLLKFVKFI